MKTRDMIILSIGIVLAAAVWGSFYNKRVPKNIIRVVGMSKKRFETDTVKWQVRLARNVSADELAEGYTLIRQDMDKLLNQLEERGIVGDGITVQPVATNQLMNHQRGIVTGYKINQGLFVISRKIEPVEELAINPDAVVSRGIILESSNLQYFYDDVDKLKIELLGAAAADARRRAGEIADSTGDTIGSLMSARAGVFQITEPYSTEVRGYGIHATSTRHKDIKVTVHAEFEIDKE